MSEGNYHPESYWTKVGKRIKSRETGKNVIAGDDEPYYRYKRNRFLDLLKGVNFSSKNVLEVGSGPGGNLLEISKLDPQSLTGVDISEQMVNMAKEKLPSSVVVVKIDGTSIPFDDNHFDIVFTATVLQHNTDEEMLKQIMSEICRVSKNEVYLFERIESTILGDELCYGRPVDYYSTIMAEHGFTLKSKKFINVRVSYYVSGAIRKLLNPKTREEGEPINGISTLLQNLSLPITKVLDRIFVSGKDVARLQFVREK